MRTAPLPAPASTDPALLGHPEARRLRRLRWAVRTVLTLGVAASIAANVLHARPHPVSQIIAAWPPLALLLTVELISRVPSHRRPLAVLRMLATTAIASIAAWVSYWHMAGVAARYGETDAGASYLLPLSVDGLVVVASISLVEIAGRIRSCNSLPATASAFAGQGQPPVTLAQTVPVPAAGQRSTKVRAAPEPPAPPPASTTTATRQEEQRQEDAWTGPADAPRNASNSAEVSAPGAGKNASPSTSTGRRAGQGRPPRQGAANAKHADGNEDGARDDGGASRARTSEAVAYWYQRDPSLHPAQIAAKIGRSERTVRRYWPPLPGGRASRRDRKRPADQLRAVSPPAATGRR